MARFAASLRHKENTSLRRQCCSRHNSFADLARSAYGDSMPPLPRVPFRPLTPDTKSDSAERSGSGRASVPQPSEPLPVHRTLRKWPAIRVFDPILSRRICGRIGNPPRSLREWLTLSALVCWALQIAVPGRGNTPSLPSRSTRAHLQSSDGNKEALGCLD